MKRGWVCGEGVENILSRGNSNCKVIVIVKIYEVGEFLVCLRDYEVGMVVEDWRRGERVVVGEVYIF